VSGGLPASTMEQFFDAGYQCNDYWAVRWAVQYRRPDILGVLFERGKKIRTAWFSPRQELLDTVEENKDADMVPMRLSMTVSSCFSIRPLPMHSPVYVEDDISEHVYANL
jgi:hypothetical protein